MGTKNSKANEDSRGAKEQGDCGYNLNGTMEVK